MTTSVLPVFWRVACQYTAIHRRRVTMHAPPARTMPPPSLAQPRGAAAARRGVAPAGPPDPHASRRPPLPQAPPPRAGREIISQQVPRVVTGRVTHHSGSCRWPARHGLGRRGWVARPRQGVLQRCAGGAGGPKRCAPRCCRAGGAVRPGCALFGASPHGVVYNEGTATSRTNSVREKGTVRTTFTVPAPGAMPTP